MGIVRSADVFRWLRGGLDNPHEGATNGQEQPRSIKDQFRDRQDGSELCEGRFMHGVPKQEDRDRDVLGVVARCRHKRNGSPRAKRSARDRRREKKTEDRRQQEIYCPQQSQVGASARLA